LLRRLELNAKYGYTAWPIKSSRANMLAQVGNAGERSTGGRIDELEELQVFPLISSYQRSLPIVRNI